MLQNQRFCPDLNFSGLLKDFPEKMSSNPDFGLEKTPSSGVMPMPKLFSNHCGFLSLDKLDQGQTIKPFVAYVYSIKILTLDLSKFVLGQLVMELHELVSGANANWRKIMKRLKSPKFT